MHTNIYAEDLESGIKDVRVSKIQDKYGNESVEVEFNNNTAVAFYGKTLETLSLMLAKMHGALEQEQLMRLDQ